MAFLRMLNCLLANTGTWPLVAMALMANPWHLGKIGASKLYTGMRTCFSNGTCDLWENVCVLWQVLTTLSAVSDNALMQSALRHSYWHTSWRPPRTGTGACFHTVVGTATGTLTGASTGAAVDTPSCTYRTPQLLADLLAHLPVHPVPQLLTCLLANLPAHQLALSLPQV